MARLFVALRPPPAMRGLLRATMHGLSGARWQSDEQLHLTLRFIGDVDRDLYADVVAALAQVDAPTLALGVEGVGVFASRGRPHSLWASVPAPPDLSRIVKAVDRALLGVGIPSETRAFRAHITLARLGSSTPPIDPWLAANAGLHVEPAPFAHFYLREHPGSGRVELRRGRALPTRLIRPRRGHRDCPRGPADQRTKKKGPAFPPTPLSVIALRRIGSITDPHPDRR
ncbi:RNA 2',3'-cyclic phosphodiesterase [Sphingomonas sp. BIUV-7]|uniref:RNA 2',3'-cyclic phosphodiesterase n=1 Tax=Sphingomonas natans TaxID=3063330 RepID=A0ABT8Y638_9SPHN|nr:RNA 2',3'-cyclic phosphodiesterase [Sphingomonas sp. BIUV-7]MDO6413784.1 RNA 2',3'-cyclic phosphodiesterase [Sphingomonas sp. BIUV-7]